MREGIGQVQRLAFLIFRNPCVSALVLPRQFVYESTSSAQGSCLSAYSLPPASTPPAKDCRGRAVVWPSRASQGNQGNRKEKRHVGYMLLRPSGSKGGGLRKGVFSTHFLIFPGMLASFFYSNSGKICLWIQGHSGLFRKKTIQQPHQNSYYLIAYLVTLYADISVPR